MNKFLDKIVHTIVPNQKNRNVPHILGDTSILSLLCIVLALFIFVNESSYLAYKLNLTATVYPAVLADLANRDRAAEGIKNLNWNDTLAQAAEKKGEDMFANQYFAHTSPAGLTPWYWLSEIKYNFIYAGENLAIRFTDSDAVENAWWNSPTHRANIVNEKFSDIGIAAVDGIFQGQNTTIVVEYFGTQAASVPFLDEPVPAPVATAPTPKTIPTPNPKPTVAGVENNSPKVAITPKIETIKQVDQFVAVKNTEINEVDITPTPATPAPAPQVAWYKKLIVNPVNTVRIIYLAIILAILSAMSLMLFNEYEKHHLKHLSYGFGLVVIVVFLLNFIGPALA